MCGLGGQSLSGPLWCARHLVNHRRHFVRVLLKFFWSEGFCLLQAKEVAFPHFFPKVIALRILAQHLLVPLMAVWSLCLVISPSLEFSHLLLVLLLPGESFNMVWRRRKTDKSVLPRTPIIIFGWDYLSLVSSGGGSRWDGLGAMSPTSLKTWCYSVVFEDVYSSGTDGLKES